MPYTRDELENVEFYQEFVGNLRNSYLNKISNNVANFFRDEAGALISFEDVFTGLGLEDASLEESLYASVLPVEFYIDDLGYNMLHTITNEKLPKYLKTNNLESIIDRNIIELAEDLYADELPSGIVNGMVVKMETANDTRKWRIENNQKRLFLNLTAFFGNGHTRQDLITIDKSKLKNIPNGDPIA